MNLPERRQELGRCLDELVEAVTSLDTRHAQLRASLYQQRIRCGRPTCHCADGSGHPRWCLAFASGRGRHTRTVSRDELREITAPAERYRRYRQVRARIVVLCRKVLRLVDQIQGGLAQTPRPPRR